MENSEISGSGTISARSAQLLKKKNARKAATLLNLIKMEVAEITRSCLNHNCSAAAQSVPPIKKQYDCKPSTSVNSMENSASGTAPTQSALHIQNKPTIKLEIIDSDTAPTQSIMDKSAGNSTAVYAEIKTEAIDSDTAPSTSAQPIRKKSSRKPSKVVKRGIYRKPFKKNHFKAPRSIFIPVASETLDYKDSFFTRGDIVSVVDHDDRVYYAQIRGLLQNQYSEKCAVLTWLLPTTQSPKGRFDPKTYILGHEEDIPRDLALLEFVCHAPSDYFKLCGPNPASSQKPDLGFAQTRKGFVIVKLPCEEFNTDSE